MWMDAAWFSKLVIANRPGTGTVRNVIDMAEAIHKDLGSQLSLYTERQLQKELEGRRPLGYVVEERDGVGHIGLSSMPAALRPRTRPKLVVGERYG
jgi:hypothetical protein